MRCNQKGFTYIELIIVIAIFSIITVIVGSTFVLFTRAQSLVSVKEKLIADGRYLFETVTRATRVGRIDYEAYPQPLINPVQSLSIIDSDDNKIKIYLTEVGCPTGINRCIFMDSGNGDFLISGGDVEVDYLNFFIQPTADPFIIGENGAYNSSSQPMVTMSIGISSIVRTDKRPISLQLQTTISSKMYVR